VPLLRRHDRAVNITVANLRAALQRRGDVLQERIPISNAQRPGGAEDGVVARAAQTWFVAERQPVVELELHPTTTARGPRSPPSTPPGALLILEQGGSICSEGQEGVVCEREEDNQCD
jgi:hypothetical protein